MTFAQVAVWFAIALLAFTMALSLRTLVGLWTERSGALPCDKHYLETLHNTGTLLFVVAWVLVGVLIMFQPWLRVSMKAGEFKVYIKAEAKEEPDEHQRAIQLD